MVRPSFRRTLSESSSKDTSATLPPSRLLSITSPTRGLSRSALPFLLSVASRQRQNSLRDTDSPRQTRQSHGVGDAWRHPRLEPLHTTFSVPTTPRTAC